MVTDNMLIKMMSSAEREGGVLPEDMCAVNKEDLLDLINGYKKLTAKAFAAAKKWFYESFDDELLEEMEKHKLIAQAEGFSISCIAELSNHIEAALTDYDA